MFSFLLYIENRGMWKTIGRLQNNKELDSWKSRNIYPKLLRDAGKFDKQTTVGKKES